MAFAALFRTVVLWKTEQIQEGLLEGFFSLHFHMWLKSDLCRFHAWWDQLHPHLSGTAAGVKHCSLLPSSSSSSSSTMASLAAQVILHPKSTQFLKVLSSTVGRDKVSSPNLYECHLTTTYYLHQRSRSTDWSRTLLAFMHGYYFEMITKTQQLVGLLWNPVSASDGKVGVSVKRVTGGCRLTESMRRSDEIG